MTKYRQLRLNKIGTISHDFLKSLVTCTALPLRDEMQHVFALSCHTIFFTLVAHQSDLQLRKNRLACNWILDFEKPGVETKWQCGSSSSINRKKNVNE